MDRISTDSSPVSQPSPLRQSTEDAKERYYESEKEVVPYSDKQLRPQEDKYTAFSTQEKESAPDRGHGKQVLEFPDKELVDLETSSTERTRIRQIFMKKRIIGLLTVSLGVFIATVIAVAVTTTRHRSSTPRNGSQGSPAASDYAVGGAIDPSYYSPSGIFNGTGIALAETNWRDMKNDSSDKYYVFAADYQGHIKQYILHGNNQSLTEIQTVATDARNATRLAAVAYVLDEISSYHIVYFDQLNRVREKVAQNTTGFIWRDGPLSDNNITALDAETSTLQMCIWVITAGDADFYGGEIQPNSSAGPGTGMHLWYATNETQIAQYSFLVGQSSWSYNGLMNNVNGRAGLGCQTWLNWPTAYIILLDPNNNVNIYWKDVNTTKVSTPTHPMNSWTKAPFTISDVHPSSSIGYSDYLVLQDTQGAIQGYNITWAAENTTVVSTPLNGLEMSQFETPGPVVKGTQLAVTPWTTATGERLLQILYQAEGDDLSLLSSGSRDYDKPWTAYRMTGPD